MTQDKPGFDEIYQTFRPNVLRFLGSLVGDEEAEDLTQEVFAKISKAFKDFRGSSQISTWVYRIAANTATDRMRSPIFQKKSHTLSLGNRSSGETLIDVAWVGKRIPPVEQQLIRKEMNECIRDVVWKLPEEYRTVTVLSELEGFKNREIADILGLTLGNVKIRLHRARQKLRAEFEARCSFYRDERNEFACDLKASSKRTRR